MRGDGPREQFLILERKKLSIAKVKLDYALILQVTFPNAAAIKAQNSSTAFPIDKKLQCSFHDFSSGLKSSEFFRVQQLLIDIKWSFVPSVELPAIFQVK
jgi:hypothetical protein